MMQTINNICSDYLLFALLIVFVFGIGVGVIVGITLKKKEVNKDNDKKTIL